MYALLCRVVLCKLQVNTLLNQKHLGYKKMQPRTLKGPGVKRYEIKMGGQDKVCIETNLLID